MEKMTDNMMNLMEKRVNILMNLMEKWINILWDIMMKLMDKLLMIVTILNYYTLPMIWLKLLKTELILLQTKKL